jgi:2-polyprenyl-3-methyl-5-hydroxy-6-metoxy-1,4-benzoquinol methylase
MTTLTQSPSSDCTPHCVLCESTHLTPLKYHDAKTQQPLSIALCETCGLVQQTPMPTATELLAYYSHHYRVDYMAAYQPKPKHIYRAGSAALTRLQFLQKNAIPNTGRLMDIGAGGGEFVYMASKMGWDAHGIEPNIGYAEYAANTYGTHQRCQIQTAQIADLEGRYHLMTIFHVLEHLPNPRQAIAQMAQHIEDNGHLFIEVPWIEAQDASPHNIFFKAHLTYFSADTLRACVEPWFEIVAVDTHSNLRLLCRKRSIDLNHPAVLINPATYLPSQASIQHTQQRLAQKGWLEYLTQGGGWKKPFKRIHQYLYEHHLKHHDALTILNQLLDRATIQHKVQPSRTQHSAPSTSSQLHHKSRRALKSM